MIIDGINIQRSLSIYYRYAYIKHYYFILKYQHKIILLKILI